MGTAQWFTVCDLASEMAPEDREKQLYPVTNCMDSWACRLVYQMIRQLFSGWWRECYLWFYGVSAWCKWSISLFFSGSHVLHIAMVCLRLRDLSLPLKQSKYKFAADQVVHLGHALAPQAGNSRVVLGALLI